MSETIRVKFTRDYCASRGMGINGKKDAEQELPANDQVAALLEDGTLKAVKKGAASRKKATKEPDEKS